MALLTQNSSLEYSNAVVRRVRISQSLLFHYFCALIVFNNVIHYSLLRMFIVFATHWYWYTDSERTLNNKVVPSQMTAQNDDANFNTM